MIKAIIDQFYAKRQDLLAQFKANRPNDYLDIVKAVVSAVTCQECNLDPENITVINSDDDDLVEPVIDAAIHGYMKLKGINSNTYDVDDIHNIIKDLGNYNELCRKIMFYQIDNAVKKMEVQ